MMICYLVPVLPRLTLSQNKRLDGHEFRVAHASNSTTQGLGNGSPQDGGRSASRAAGSRAYFRAGRAAAFFFLFLKGGGDHLPAHTTRRCADALRRVFFNLRGTPTVCQTGLLFLIF
jgi:hypothetical protein